MIIYNEKGTLVDTSSVEVQEQRLANAYIQENDVVLELGARYGSVSCIINSKLNCKTNQVVVEPDERVWAALERNKEVNNCNFHILKGFLSGKKLELAEMNSWDGYGTTSVESSNSTIPSMSLDEVKAKYGLNFNVLVADCEGFLETFFDENPTFYDQIRLILFEADCPHKCNYAKIRNTLRSKGFRPILNEFQNVWMK
jgi:FkbM family methyltransferase